jgi:hypothetical protein
MRRDELARPNQNLLLVGAVTGMRRGQEETSNRRTRSELSLHIQHLSGGGAAKSWWAGLCPAHQFTSGMERERRASNDWFSNTYGPAAW